MDYNEHINKLISILQSIEPGQVTILTGNNGSGKSVIRKLIRQFLSKKVEAEGKEFNIASTSMDDRAGVDAGRMMVFTRDCEWLPTSENTVDAVRDVLKAKDCYMILDEIELGMGEELQAGLALEINAMLDTALSNGHGLLIITHSRTMVRNIHHDVFINIEGKTEEEWLNREIIPISPDTMKEKSANLRVALEKRLKH